MRPRSVLGTLRSVVDLTIRSHLQFGLHQESRWFTDKERVAALVEAVLALPFGSRTNHAGVFARERPKRDTAAIVESVATGKAASFCLLDAATQQTAETYLALDIEPDDFRFSMLLQGEALDAVSDTLFNDLESLAFSFAERMRDLGGLYLGFAHVLEGRAYKRPRATLPKKHRRYEVDSVLDLVDSNFHQSDHDLALPNEASAMKRTPTPATVRRTERAGLLALRWIDGCDDIKALSNAASLHAKWMKAALK